MFENWIPNLKAGKKKEVVLTAFAAFITVLFIYSAIFGG